MQYRFLLAGLLLTRSAMAQMSVADSDIALHAPDAAWRAYGKVQAWAAYDAIPIRDFTGDWGAHYTPRDGRNVFMQRDRAEAGVEKDGWRIGLEYRLEMTLASNRDTVEMYHFYLQRKDPDGDRRFVADAHLKSWAAGGMRVGRTFALGDSKAPMLLMVSGAAYSNARNRDGEAGGSVTYSKANAYRFDGVYFGSNTNYTYPFMPEAEQKSSGATLSAALQWPLSSELTANLAVNDLWSRMRWSNLPVIDKVIHSDVRSVDKDGYINYQPQIYGKSSLIERRGTIGASTALNLSYVLNQWTLRAGVERIAGINIPRVSGGYATAWGTFSTSYDSRFNMIGVGYDYGPFRARLSGNRLPLLDSSAFAAELGLHYIF
ncbi:hypothetical protein GTP45_19165 [Pseudoduganella sp. FT55W]|uniref:Porin n=1 Tax=Duganella rivi TaxID=2666083 RepID=A0A7X4GUP7_9BURK|nr:hypothetical protein [Duganella rivi]MYM68939.1 hypothetical protein [Duganella rivi]